jgi:AbrB family looped-hinge helix DNA binding protein
MSMKVKGESARKNRKPGKPLNPKTNKDRRSSRISTKNQITIPAAALRSAGLKPGDSVVIETHGRGQLTLSSVDEIMAQFAGRIDTGGKLREQINELRNEWQ